MSADSPRRSNIRGVPAVVPPEVVSDRSIIDSVAGFINDVTLANQPIGDPKDTIIWARFESAADISDPRFGDDWELEGNVAPPLLLILGYGMGVQIWAIPANGEAVEVLSWRHGIVSALRILPKPVSGDVSRADEPIDVFSDRRPLMAICDGGQSSQGGSNPQFCSVNFLSLRTGTQVKTIKFKNPVLDILANRTSVVVTFHERIAIFDARTLEDRLTVTTCFPSPGVNPNPVALGSRWLAYSENKLLASKRSGGGCDGDGVASYTATVLNAAKSLGKGLREFTEQVTAGLTGTTGSGSTSKSASFDSSGGDIRQPGIVTILDIKYAIKDMSPTSGTPISVNGTDPIVAHFIAHSEAIVAMEFDNSGMMLLTADKRGHNFHVFRIQPHPVGSTLAAVHHLYILHRGDTSAKVQNISFSLDTRWVAVSTLRGTTHVFPITPYGGQPTARTHSNLHVVNKLSSFHHSAGLTADGRSSSPISHTDTTNFSQQLMPYFNQTMPPFPRPTFVLPLAQLRQPFTLSNNAPASAAAPKTERGNRQRLSSLSDDNGKPLSVCAVFAKSRSWLLDPPNSTRDGPSHKLQRKAVDSLFVMAGHGALIQYDLDVSYVAKDKKCDDKSIDLEVEAKAQWNLGRRDPNTEIMPPLPSDNWLVKDRMSCALVDSSLSDDHEDRNDCWLAQVEIITHAGPSRRLWMGPQFVFKTYNTPSGSSLSHIDSEAVEIGMTASSKTNQERSSPLNMPVSSGSRSTVPVLIESGSYSSIEQSPKLMDRFRHDYMDSDYSLAHGESRLKEDLADAMRESPSVAHKNTGLTPTLTQTTVLTTSQTSSESSSQSYHQIFENVVNPLGTVTTVNLLAEAEDPLADNPYVKFSPEDYVIHENCDESLFRPVVVFCDNKTDRNIDENGEYTKPPAAIENKLVVPVIDKSLHMVLTKKEAKRAEDKFDELSSINKMSKGIDIQQKDDIKSEDIQVKEEQVVTTKGKKNKKKVAEAPVKESTPPRDIKKKTKQDELNKIHDNEPLKKEKISEVVVKEAVKVTESKKTLEQTKETAPKPVERKKSLEVAQSKKVSNEPTKEVPISNEEVTEVTITLKKKGKNKKESSPEVVEVLTKSEDSSSSEEHSFESVKDLSKEESTSEAKSKESSKKVRDSKVEDKKESKIDLSKSEKVKDQTENLKKEEISKDILEQSAVEDLKAEEQSKKEDSEVKIEKVNSSKEDTKDLEDTKSEQKSVKAEDSTTKVSGQKVSKKKTKPNSRSPSPAKEHKEIVVEPKPEPISSKKKSKSSSRSSSPAKEVKKEENIEPKSEASSSKKKSSSADKDIKQEEIKKEIEVGKDEPDLSKKTKPSSRSSSPAKEETVKEDLFLSKKNVKPSSRSSSPAKEVAKEEKETIKEELVLPKKKAKSNLRSSSPSKEETVKEEPIISKKKAKQSSRSSSPSKEETAKEDIVSSKKKTKPCSRSSSPAKEETVKEDLVSSQKKIKPSSRSSSPAKEQTIKESVSSKKKAQASSRSSSPAKEEVKEETDKDESNLSKKKAKSSSRSSSPTKEMEKEQKVSSDMKKQEAVEQTKDEIIPANKKSKSKKQSRESSPEVELPTSVEKMPPSKAEEQPTSSKKKNKNKKASRECSPEVTTSRKNSIEDSKTIAKIPDSEKEYKVNVKEISPPKDEPKITDFLKFVDHFNKSIEPEDQVYKVSVKDISPPETDHDFPSLSFSTKKSKKNKKPTTEMVLPIEKEKEPIIETLSPFQPGTLDKVVPAEEGATLINFESPEAINKINLLDFERPKGFPEKIIFAVCGQLSDPNEMVESEKEFLTSSSTASASEETTDETANTPETTKKKKTKKLVSPCNLNDDEELRPLISTTADTIEATPTPEVLYPCKYSEKDAKSSDSSSDTGGSGSYAIPEAAVVAPQPELQQQTSNQQQQHQSSSKKKMKRRKR